MKVVAACFIGFYVCFFALIILKVVNEWRRTRHYKIALRILRAEALEGGDGYKEIEN